MVYTTADYNTDRQYVQMHDSLPKGASPEAKLDVLVNSGVDKLFINVPSIVRSPRGCILTREALGILKYDAVMVSKLHEKNQNLPVSELNQLVSGLRNEISLRVTEVFEQKYNGARKRMLAGVEKYLKLARTAVGAELEDLMCDRLPIMLENLPDDHPLVKKYDRLYSRFVKQRAS